MDSEQTVDDPAGAADSAHPPSTDGIVPLVGLGGASSSMPALHAFFRAMPPDSGMAFVVTIHAEIGQDFPVAAALRADTAMPVIELTASETVEPDHVYVVPVGKLLHAGDGRFDAVDPQITRGRHVAVDLFLRTIADSHGPRATAIVLSGTDGDGAIGVKRMKERGGLTIVQDPGEATDAGMPRSAIATGMVDWILPASDIPARLIEYRRLESRLELPAEDGPDRAPRSPGAADPETALREVLAFVRIRTGHDFSYYKRATVLRRVARRMQVNGVADMAAYLECLRTSTGEAEALLQDLLISVTNFFRDPLCFAALGAQLPELFRSRRESDVLRVWVPACATGEEAYSIAMMLVEHAQGLEKPPILQVFATDLDEHSIRTARGALYPETIEADVSPERLARFFVKQHQGYRLRRELREIVMFAVHDLLKDAPFSRLDLVSCRNLLIYLTREAQERTLDVFRFALRDEGRLFLGASESIDESSTRFVDIDKKCRLYAPRPNARNGVPILPGPGTLAFRLTQRPRALLSDVPRRPLQAGFPSVPRFIESPAEGRAATWASLHFKLLERIAPPSLIVDAEHNVVHLSPGAGRFLQIAGGEPTKNLLRLVDPALRIELRAALFQAQQSGDEARFGPARVDLDGRPMQVGIRVAAASDDAPDHFLVVFEARHADLPSAAPDSGENAALLHPVAEHLDREVERLRLHLRDTVEQYEASNEELKAGNEELQAMNEELRSATEELETGREELQSINEEFSTVNSELKVTVEELGGANSDMLNLMDATAIPAVFLDCELRITRYTPPAVDVFNLIPADIGRPLSDLRAQLDYPELADDAQRVLRRLAPVEREISRGGDHWYSARLLPYRTLDDHIAGVVLTLVDMTERRRSEVALRAGEERLRLVVENARDYAIFSLDLERRVTTWNPGAERILGYREAEVLGQSADLIFTEEEDAAGVPMREAATALEAGRAADDRFHRRKDGSRFWASGVMMSMRDAAGAAFGFVKILRDQTEARRTQEALERSQHDLLKVSHESERARREAELQKEHLAALFTQAPAPICILRGPSYVIEFANDHMCRLWARPHAEVIGRPVFEAVPGMRVQVLQDVLEGVTSTGVPRVAKEVASQLERDGDGVLVDVYLNFTYAPLRDVGGAIDGVLVMAHDVTDEVHAREQMSILHEAAQAAGRAKDNFLAMLGHELRNPLAPLQNSLHLIRAQQPPAGIAKLIEIMQRQTHNLTRIVDDLLEASRVNEGKIELRIETLDVRLAITQALAAAQAFLDTRRHSVIVALPDAAVPVDADPVRLEQIVLNLLNNAGKYTPLGGRIDVRLAVHGDRAELRVVDNGVGIDADLRPRLFQIFQQGNRDLSRGEGGLGIGLSVVRRLVELHQGTVEAESAGAGKGSTFVVRLPISSRMPAAPEEMRSALDAATAGDGATPGDVATASDDAAVGSGAAAGHGAAGGPSLRALVVDDNRDAGETLVMLLNALGHETRFAEDGLEALRLFDAWTPAIAFLDIGLPGMDGYALAAEIRRRQPADTPRLVAVTGYGQDRDRAKSRQAGFDDHVVKPASFEAIESILAQTARAGAVVPE